MLPHRSVVACPGRRQALARLVPVAVATVALPACSLFKPSAITEVQLKAVAAANVNPDVRKRPSPIVIRVYELKARTQFDALDFLSLTERDKDTLGADLLSREEFVMRPGETKSLVKKVSAEARFIGVTAGYRDLERAQWRAVTAIQGQSSTDFQIQVEALAVSIAARP
ncbi:MAG: type VI secretion system lipoprotein TssJ [Acidobacteriota bacterium]